MNRQVRALKTRSWACKSLKSRIIIRLLSAESLCSTEVPGGDGSLTKLNNEAGRRMKSTCILFLSAGISILPTVEGTIFSANLQPRHFCTMREVYPHLLLDAPLVRSPCQTRFSAQWYSCESDAFDQDHVSKNLRNTAEERVWWRRSNAAGLACKPPLWLCW